VAFFLEPHQPLSRLTRTESVAQHLARRSRAEVQGEHHKSPHNHARRQLSTACIVKNAQKADQWQQLAQSQESLKEARVLGFEPNRRNSLYAFPFHISAKLFSIMLPTSE